jgi:carboxymethylenebutenolidase
MGFCMGGALTLIAAQKATVDCAVAFYGIPGADACDVSKISIPVQAHFGLKDNLAGFSDETAARKLEELLTSENKTVYFYEGVGHAFMNVTPEPYEDFAAREAKQGFPPVDEKVVDLAWSRVKAFFAKELL